MILKNKRVLFILPELAGTGGMELENLGFIHAAQDIPNIEIRVINFYSNPDFFKKSHFQTLNLSFFQKAQLFISVKFLKIYLKSGFKMDKSLANLSINFPEVLFSFFSQALDSASLCFASIRPGNLLHFVHDLSLKSHVPFVYHEISKFNPKHKFFFNKVNSNGTFLISGIEKKEDLLLIFPRPNVKEIKQWLYDGQEVFLNIPDPDFERMVFGTVSRLDYGKNFEVIFEAIAILKKQGKSIKFLLFGDGPLLLKLKELAAQLDIQSNIEFRGAIKIENRSSVYSEIDVFLMSSVIEGGPVTILEAMASGRPAISTNVGDVRNRIVEGFNGYILSSPNDPSELADKICNYLKNPELVIQHSINSRAKFKKDFDAEKCKKTFQEAITRLIEN